MKKYYPLYKSNLILKLILLVLTLFLSTFAYFYTKAYPILMYIIILLFVILYIVAAFIIVPVYFTKVEYYISETEIGVKRGFFIYSKQVMKISAIQYVTTVSVPILRKKGFNFLNLTLLAVL